MGNALGAGSAASARRAALAAAVGTPGTWLVVAVLLGTPATQGALLRLFTDGSDPLLLQRMRHLLYLVVLLELFDGIQTVLSGIVAGAGRQRHGTIINVVAYWVLAVSLKCPRRLRGGVLVPCLHTTLGARVPNVLLHCHRSL